MIIRTNTLHLQGVMGMLPEREFMVRSGIVLSRHCDKLSNWEGV